MLLENYLIGNIDDFVKWSKSYIFEIFIKLDSDRSLSRIQYGAGRTSSKDSRLHYETTKVLSVCAFALAGNLTI